MRWSYRQGIRLVIAIISGICPLSVWSGDVPGSMIATETPRTVNAMSNTAPGLSGIVPARFATPNDWRDAAGDQCEELRPHFPSGHLLGTRPVRRKVQEIRGWFWYIRGHGPAIWVPD